MEKIAGGKADTVEPAERDAAYIQSCAQMARRVELLMMLESAGEPDLDSLWQGVLDRWSPPVPDDDDPAALARFVARLAADGLWVHEAMSNRPLPAKRKERVCRELVTMAESMTRDSKNS